MVADRGGHLRLVPVEVHADAVGVTGKRRGERLVDDPEQSGLEVGGQPPVGPGRIEVDRDAAPLGPIAGGATKRGHQPEVVEDHRSNVEDECLRRREGRLDHPAHQDQLLLGTWIAAADEPLDDFRLQGDVGEALCRAVVDLAGDLLAQLLLGAKDRHRVC